MRHTVTSQAGWGGEPCCVGLASLGTGPAEPPRAQDPSGLVSLGRNSTSELPSRSLPDPTTPKSIRPCLFSLLPLWRMRAIHLHPGEFINHVSGRLSTGFEEDQGLHAGKLRGVHCQRPEPGDGLLQEAHFCTSQDQPALRAAAAAATGGLRWGQQWAAVQGQRPLYGSQEEKLIPRLFQQDHL